MREIIINIWNGSRNYAIYQFSLALSYENDPSSMPSPIHYGVSWPDLVDEAVWGADFLAKITSMMDGFTQSYGV